MASGGLGFVFLILLTAFFVTDCVAIPRGDQVEAAFPKDRATQNDPTYYKRFLHGFLASVYVIVISELGDKTFFIAAILSIDHPRLLVYGGAMFALVTMTVLSALLGFATEVLPRVYTYYASGFLFILFGVKMLKDAYNMKPEDTKEEYKEVEQQLSANETGETVSCFHIRSFLRGILSPIFVEAFVMTFLAEWGDRSQITTIVLAAREDVTGVIAGGVLGHGLCTGLAVLAGRIVAQRIPVKWCKSIYELLGGLSLIGFMQALGTVACPRSLFVTFLVVGSMGGGLTLQTLDQINEKLLTVDNNNYGALIKSEEFLSKSTRALGVPIGSHQPHVTEEVK
ncbi:hypothetical protein TSMEX_009215 [Taenia solium]|eukprot:TsM_000852800 transcript=TsM_000852800 gene=TsM_000852800